MKDSPQERFSLRAEGQIADLPVKVAVVNLKDIKGFPPRSAFSSAQGEQNVVPNVAKEIRNGFTDIHLESISERTGEQFVDGRGRQVVKVILEELRHVLQHFRTHRG